MAKFITIISAGALFAALLSGSATAQTSSSYCGTGSVELFHTNPYVTDCNYLGSYTFTSTTESFRISDSEADSDVQLRLSNEGVKVQVTVENTKFLNSAAIQFVSGVVAPDSTFTITNCKFFTVDPSASTFSVDFAPEVSFPLGGVEITVSDTTFDATLAAFTPYAFTATRIRTSLASSKVTFNKNIVYAFAKGVAPRTSGITSLHLGGDARDGETVDFTSNVMVVRGNVSAVDSVGLRYTKTRVLGESQTAVRINAFDNLLNTVAVPFAINVANGEALAISITNNQAVSSITGVVFNVTTTNDDDVSAPIDLTIKNNQLTSSVDAAQVKLGLPYITAGSNIAVDSNVFTTANPGRAAIVTTSDFKFAANTVSGITRASFNSNKVVSTVPVAEGDAMFDFVAAARSPAPVSEYLSICYNEFAGHSITTLESFKAVSLFGFDQIPLAPIEECYFAPTDPAVHEFVSAAADRAVVGKTLVGVVAAALFALIA